MNHAPCLFGDCDTCASREVQLDDFEKTYACFDAIDIHGNYLPPCASCSSRYDPVTPDHEAYMVDQYLQSDQHSSGEDSVPMSDAIFADMMTFMDRVESEQREKDNATFLEKAIPYTPVQRAAISNAQGQSRTYTYYKPFTYERRIRTEEREDFKEFLRLIF